MKEKTKNKWIKKVTIILGMLLVFCAVMLVLTHSAKNGRKTTERLPEISDSPLYVECMPNEPVEASLIVTEDISISGLQILLVNISPESRGSLHVTMRDDAQNILFEQTLPVNTIVPGEWFTVSGEAVLESKTGYTVTFLADDSAPYFMQVAEEDCKKLPFAETVYVNGVESEYNISMGVNEVTPVELTFGEIFYYSVPFSVIALIAGILLVLFGKEKVVKALSVIPIKEFFKKYGNEVFLILIFIFSCMGIYSDAYVKGVYITSDSAGYLREAVNLVKGNGFFYDGMAGYTGWFANWPILYPLSIAGVMLVTGTNAYLSSKIVAMLMVGLILTVLYLFYKKEAWIYALCVLNLGFVTLTHYTWSEVPFILFLLLFALFFAKIVQSDMPRIRDFVFLGIAGVGCFLTRYFGIYIWMVTGLYILYYAWEYYKKRQKQQFVKVIGLTATAMVSGILSLGYLFMNKIMNGHASGVSRTLWWDDYEILTNDLIQSLLTEICNIFSVQIPDFIDSYPYNLKVLLLALIFVGLILFVKKTAKWESTEGVMITFGVCYYVIFIAIRYVSSMDTFYFRFFEPASFLICLGLLGLLLPYVRKKTGMAVLYVMVFAFMLLGMASMVQNDALDGKNAYYHSLTEQWDKVYQEIPEKSVVIFSDLDFRSSYYRPDVIGGEIRPEYSFEEVCRMYQGSDYLCIKTDFAMAMLESGEYEESMAAKLKEALEASVQDTSKKLQDNEEYAIIRLVP